MRKYFTWRFHIFTFHVFWFFSPLRIHAIYTVVPLDVLCIYLVSVPDRIVLLHVIRDFYFDKSDAGPTWFTAHQLYFYSLFEWCATLIHTIPYHSIATDCTHFSSIIIVLDSWSFCLCVRTPCLLVIKLRYSSKFQLIIQKKQRFLKIFICY